MIHKHNIYEIGRYTWQGHVKLSSGLFTCEECLDICHQTKKLALLHRVIKKMLPASVEHVWLLLKLKLFILLNFRLIFSKLFFDGRIFNEAMFVENVLNLIIFDQMSNSFYECLQFYVCRTPGLQLYLIKHQVYFMNSWISVYLCKMLLGI